jgi:predicted  nucleic acid-binding Zn-ribbon protein
VNKVTKEEALRYELEALEDNLDRIDHNIEIFEQAIRDERAQKERLQQMINLIELHQDG